MDELRHPDFPVRKVLAAIVASFALLSVAVGSIYLLYGAARPGDYARPDDLGPPRLETTPVADHAAWMTQQRALLEGAEGRTPIAEAMAQIAERGARAFDPLTGAEDGE